MEKNMQDKLVAAILEELMVVCESLLDNQAATMPKVPLSIARQALERADEFHKQLTAEHVLPLKKE